MDSGDEYSTTNLRERAMAYYSSLDREHLKAVDLVLSGNHSMKVYLTLQTIDGKSGQSYLGKSNMPRNNGIIFNFPPLCAELALLHVLVEYDYYELEGKASFSVSVAKGHKIALSGGYGLDEKDILWKGTNFYDSWNRPDVFHFEIPLKLNDPDDNSETVVEISTLN